MRRTIFSLYAALTCAILAAACASKGTSTFVPGAQPNVETASGAGTNVTVKITVATKGSSPRTVRERPQYFSASSQGLLVQVYPHGRTTLLTQVAVDISPGSKACGGKKTTPRTCSATLSLASGTDDFAVSDYNAKPANSRIPKHAKLLGYGKVVIKKIAGTHTAFSVYLGGVIAHLTGNPGFVSLPGDGAAHAVAIVVHPEDFGNHPITAGKNDPFANPITVSVTETGGSGHVLLSLDGRTGAKSVTLKGSSETVELDYDGLGSVGYGAVVTLKAPKFKNNGGAKEKIAVSPLLLASSNGDYTPGALALKGNGDYAAMQIGEVNAPSGTVFSAATQHCDAIESTMPLTQSSSSSGSFAVIARGVAATPNPAGCSIAVGDGTSTVNAVVSNTYSGSVGSPTIAMTPIPNPTGTAAPVEITVGPDGGLWFAECGAAAIGRVVPGALGTHAIAQFTVPAAAKTPGPTGLYAGIDGNLWYTDSNNQTAAVGKMTTSGTVLSTYPGPTASPGSDSITAGPDGNMWFTNWNDHPIAKMTTAGALVGTYAAGGTYQPNIALGPDGNLWFTEDTGNEIGKITTGGTITYFTPTSGAHPWGIVAGPDGAMWFTECNGGGGNGAIGRIPVNAVDGSAVQEFSTGMTGHQPVDITVGPDGALWFTYWNTAAKVGRITTAATPTVTTITEYAIPGATASYNGWGITSAPDGAIYFMDQIDNTLGRIAIASTPAAGRAGFHRIRPADPSGVPPSRRHRRQN